MATLISHLAQDLRYALRQLRRSPGYALTAVLTLALGIGATTAVYTVVYQALVAPLPYPEAQQLVMVWSSVNGERNAISVGDFLDWQRQSTSFQGLAAWSETRFNLATGEQPEEVPGRLVTPGYFGMQGIPFLRGRGFVPGEGVPGRDHEVIVTHSLWSRLGADPSLVGRSLRINGTAYTVTGVLAPGFADRLGPELFAPLAFTPAQIHHDFHWLVAMGRLKPGVSLAEAQSEMDSVTRHIAAAYPRSNTGWGARVEPLQNDFLPRERIRNLWLLLGAVGFVLLMTCVNIANLMLARGASRQREVALRSSVGASRAAIFLQFLVESLLLAAAGGALGIALGAALLRAIVSLVPEGTLPSEANFHLDPHVLLVALAVTTLTGLLFGSAPAWYASRIDPAEVLKSGGRSGTAAGSLRLRRGLIVSEVALALSLLAGAGLAIHSFYKLTRTDLGVSDIEHVLVFHLDQPAKRFAHPAEIDSYYNSMLRSLRRTPGVSSATLTTGLPLRFVGSGVKFSLVGGRSDSDPTQQPETGFNSIAPGYLRTFGTPLLEGRAFTEQDSATGLRVALVNREFVRRYLKGLDPLKQRLRIRQVLPGDGQVGSEVDWQIVGATGNVLRGDLRESAPEVDVPFAQSLSPSVTVAVRTGLDPSTITRSVSAAVHSVDPTVALARLRTLDQVKQQAMGEDRFTLQLFSAFAGMALLLAAIGIYGLISYSVAQRTGEIGLRLALGASRGNIARLIVREALRLSAAGVVLGLAGAFLVGRLMRSTLYGIGPLDPLVTLAVSALLLTAAVLAAALPARRAAAIDPMEALRKE